MGRQSQQSLYNLHPQLDEVLDDDAPFPYTLAAFIAFLDQSRSLENVEFLLEAKRYSRTYNLLENRGNPNGKPVFKSHLWGLWNRLIVQYIEFGAPREINIPYEMRQELVKYLQSNKKYPPPSILDPAVNHVKDLLQESIIPFMKACSTTSRLQSLSSPSLNEMPATVTTTRATDDGIVRKRSRIGQWLSHHAASQDPNQFLTGSVTGTEPESQSPRGSDQAESGVDDPLSTTKTYDFAAPGNRITSSKTTPEQNTRGNRSLINRMFAKLSHSSSD